MIKIHEGATALIEEIELAEKDKMRFWLKVKVSNDDSCWEWMAGKMKSGYGYFDINGKTKLAHRISWIVTNGQIPTGLCVCHKCDNPSCVRPNHLFLGTHYDNMRDCSDKGRMASGIRHGSRTHPERRPRGDNHYYRLHPERVPRGDNHPSRTHPERLARGERNGIAKLTEALVLEIRRRYAAGNVTLAKMGTEYGCRPSTIHRIVLRTAWKHI